MIYRKYCKRIMDFALSGIGILILGIPMIAISICILISEGTPVIYKQVRAGYMGKPFKIYKFRTMINNADKAGTSTKEGDPRITNIGNFLRRTSLDELPQLFNVLKGEMSIVGYRPDVVRDDDCYDNKKWTVKPGITGYAQVNGRSTISLEQLEYWENKYPDDISLFVDIMIMIKTIGVVLKREDSN